jgi:hypothetical protein
MQNAIKAPVHLFSTKELFGTIKAASLITGKYTAHTNIEATNKQNVK